MAKKTTDNAPATFNPYYRFKTVAYIEKDAPEDSEPFLIKMRSNLTMEEVQGLTIDKDSTMTNAELWDLMAPHIVEWPFHDVSTGEPIPPPSVGGGAAFKKVPLGIPTLIYQDLVSVNMGRPDPKS